MARYIEEWTPNLSHIIGYKQVADDYEPNENEAWCTKNSYLENKNKFQKKQGYDNAQVQTYLLMNDRHKATEEAVKIITKNYIIKTTRNDEKPEMWYYKEGIYVPEAKSLIKEISRELFGTASTSHLVNEVINKIEADTFVNEKNFFNEQNNNPYLLPVQNGLLDLKQKKLLGFTHEIAYFNKINAYYNPNAKCPSFIKFLREIVETKEEVLVIQEIIGFCLLRNYKYEKAFMFYGSHGRNGKSKLLEAITRLIGSDNISGVSLQDIENDDFAISNLQNKLVNIAGDISNEAIKSSGKFKGLTGRDTISANRKFKNRIDFINYAKMIYAANELPPVFTATDAFWLRWVLVKFPYQFLPPKEINALTEEERENTRVQDQSIIDKISTQEELDGMLIWALDGLERLEEQKDFSTTTTMTELKKEWLRLSNSVAAFIEDNVKEDFTSYIIKSDFLKEYQAYCVKHKIKILSDKVIKATLKDQLGIDEGQSSIGDGVRVRVWNGIRWNK